VRQRLAMRAATGAHASPRCMNPGTNATYVVSPA
jgi:hypothetical protein